MGITVSYNSYSLPNIYGTYDFGEDYETAFFSCKFMLRSTTSSGLNTARIEAEEALREPLKDLTVSFSGNSHLNFSHSSNTGMNAKVSIKAIDEVSTEISQSMLFSYTCQLPADKAGFGFRQKSRNIVSTNAAGARTIRVDMTYTAGDSDSATENFDDEAETFAATILTNLGGTGIYNLVDINRSADDQDKICNGTLVYQEILDDETEAEFNNTSIKTASAQYSVTRAQNIGISTGGYNQDPSVFVQIDYSCVVDKSVSVANTEVLYRATIKPWLIKHSKDVVGLNNITSAGLNYITRDDSFSFDPTSSTVRGRMSFFAPTSNGSIISLSETIEFSTDEGRGFDKIWNGIPDSYLVYEFGSTTDVVRNILVVQLDGEPQFPISLQDPSLLRIGHRESKTETLEGVNSAADEAEVTFVRVVAKSFQEAYRKVNFNSSVFIENVIISEQ